MNFLDRINKLRHTKQYQCKFDALMWLSRYRNLNDGRGIPKQDTCRCCHISSYEYECIMAGSPLVAVDKCVQVIQYMKKRYLQSKSEKDRESYENN